MESFYTLQGEGFHQGKAAYFIRLAGCDVGCVWCDVKESWDENKHQKYSVQEIVNIAKKSVNRQPSSVNSEPLTVNRQPSTVNSIAVITGGEPLMHDLHELTNELKAAGFKTHIETSG
ncbi:MAG: 7-carboxy-7-deazaguanine synthase QueE, partial [Bacteroidota bacterium]